MTMPLTPDELQAVDRKVASLSREVADVASLLSSRYGEADELAALARSAHADFMSFARDALVVPLAIGLETATV